VRAQQALAGTSEKPPLSAFGLRGSLSTAAAAAIAAAAAAANSRRSRAPRVSRSVAGLEEVQNVQVGDTIPDVSLDRGFPPEKFALRGFCAGKKVVLVGLPGAFTPT